MTSGAGDPPFDGSFAAVVARLRAAGCVFAEDEAALLIDAADNTTGGAVPDLEAMVVRRTAGEPLEVILGWAEFAGLRVAIRAGVFVPRRRTELMVELAVAVTGAGSTVLDLCCGSGAVARALHARRPSIRLLAADIEPTAVLCARDNLDGIGEVFEGDLFSPLSDELQESIDVITCNAPYVPTGDMRLMPPEAREHEPAVTLDGGADGLEVHRRVIAEVRDWLAPGGTLLIEASEDQAPVTAAEMERHGLAARVHHDDDLGATVVVGTLVA